MRQQISKGAQVGLIRSPRIATMAYGDRGYQEYHHERDLQCYCETWCSAGWLP